MKKAITLLSLLVFGLALVPPTSNIIEPENMVDWSIAGYDGTIPNNSATINVVTDYGAAADGVTDDGPAIQNAIDAANAGDVVFIPSGTYLIKNTLDMGEGVVLRGDCANGTKLNFDMEGTNDDCILVETFQYGTYVDAIAGYGKGSTTITVDDASGFTVGSYAKFKQENDPDKMYTDPFWNQSWAAYSVGQMFKVTEISGNQLSIYPPVAYDYDAAMNPIIRPQGQLENVGIEDLSIEKLDSGDGHTIYIKNSANCWVRNVESFNTVKAHVWVTTALNVEVRECYFHHSHDYGGGGHGYGVVLGRHVTSSLVENCIFDHLRHSMMVKEGSNSNVFGYNYSLNQFWDISTTNLPADISLHGHYPLMNLFEGNIVQEPTSADYWGPSGPGNTFFRNRVEYDDLSIKDASHLQNVVGNELVSGSNVVDEEASVMNTRIHGNNENGTISWDPAVTNQSLPNSYYLSGTPSFFGALPYPPMGPEFALGSRTIPAKERYDSGTPNTCNAFVLPVEWIDFFGKINKKQVDLTWIIGAMDNHASFEIFHSSTGKDFKSISPKIEEATARQFSHLTPTVGNNYYKIRQEDHDGKHTWSKTIMVKMKAEFPIKIYPNPVSNELFIDWGTSTATAEISLLDGQGNLLKTHFKEGIQQFKIEVAEVPNGIYFLKYKIGGYQGFEKILILRH